MKERVGREGEQRKKWSWERLCLHRQVYNINQVTSEGGKTFSLFLSSSYSYVSSSSSSLFCGHLKSPHIYPVQKVNNDILYWQIELFQKGGET